MNCIFCHGNTDSSKSIEHIIPESLGNKLHVLPKGCVCDKCNNYFATKVEKELLAQPYFISVRQRNLIKSKKDHLVPDKVLIPHKNGGWIDAWFDFSEITPAIIFRQEDSEKIKLITSKNVNCLITKLIAEPEFPNKLMSRFLAKCAFEFIQYYFDNTEFSDLITDQQLNPIRKYARYGEGEYWPYFQRRIYGEGDFFTSHIVETPYEILHEMDLLLIHEDTPIITDIEIKFGAEFFFVLVIMGIEYVINIGGPSIDGYELWLEQNNNSSPIRRGSEKWLMPNIYNNIFPQINGEVIDSLKQEKK